MTEPPAWPAGRLVLGTVQLGLTYGLANRTGRPDLNSARGIVRAAWEGGVRQFDTAQGYGESEDTLGQVFSDLGLTDNVRVITKLHPDRRPEEALDSVRDSLDKLRIPRLFGLLLHREEQLDLLDGPLGQSLRQVRAAGLAERLGVSVYSPTRALQALKAPDISIIQLPTNLLDRRFVRAGVFERAEERGVTIHIRSVFLQGLLLMAPAEVPAGLAPVRPVLEKIRALAHDLKTTPARLALAHVGLAHPQAQVLFGAERPEQVRENLSIWSAQPPPGLLEATRGLPEVEEWLLNPALWPK